MKELSIEEKAKRYDEALERARTEYKNHEAFKGFCEMLVHIFPELKESRDEKIRKWLLDFVQGLPDEGLDFHFYNLTKEEVLTWIEKQGEQKLDDKVEPIFKVGNWVVANESKYTFLVKRVESERGDLCRYQAEDTKGNIYSFYLLPNGEEEYHLWTIEDAKDGDVLVASDGSIFIYKCQRDNGVVHYIAVTPYNDLVINENDYSWDSKNVCHPATKDEQTILFERMKEAGCEWDADKKELKKL